MNYKILSFFKKNKEDIICVLSVSILFTVFAMCIGRYLANVLVDVGRELIFPELLLEGKVLYKDIWNLFGPLGYQLNALWYLLYGIKVSTLQYVGIFCSFIILQVLYAIARIFFKPFLSCAITLVIMFCAVFSTGLFNFIYPYTYSMLYAYLFILLSVYFFLLAFKNEKFRGLLYSLSFFFAGASLSSKYEYLPYLILLIIYSVFIFKARIINLICYLTSFLIVPSISYGILFYQGVTLSDLYLNFTRILNYISSESLRYFYSTTSGTYFSFKLFNQFEFKEITLSIAFIIFLYLIFDKMTKIYGKDNDKVRYISLFAGVLFFGSLQTHILFICFPYILYAVLAYTIYKKVKKHNFDLQNDISFAFLLISIICGLKTAFLLSTYGYGTFSLGLEYMALTFFCVEYIPDFTNKIGSEDLKKIFIVCSLLVCILAGATIYERISFRKGNEVKSYKGSIYDYNQVAYATQELINYIEMYVRHNESLLVIPEGVSINYMTNRDMKTYSYYCLLPQHIDTFGIKEVLETLKDAKLDYIILNDRKYPEYGGTFFACEAGMLSSDFKHFKMRESEIKLCKFVLSNYTKIETIGNEFKYTIYKNNNKLRQQFR